MAPEKFIVDINLTAVGLIYWIEKIRKKIRGKIEMRKVSSQVYSTGKEEQHCYRY